MGGVWSVFTRPVRKFNIESRVQKVLSKDKPISSPLYPKEQKQLELAKEISPEFTTKESIKDMSLDERLKQVYVKSDSDEQSSTSSRPLPTSRVSQPQSTTGYVVPDVIPPGKCILEDILNLLEQHKADPKTNNVSVLAAKYKLSEKTVDSIIDYHMLFLYGMTKEVEQKLKKMQAHKKLLV